MKKISHKLLKKGAAYKPLRKSIRQKIGIWSRRGMPKKTKEMWHIPKRSSFDQMKEIIKILIDLDLNNKVYKGNKDRINRELARRGLTEGGTMLTSSAFGTLMALVKYFGYIFIKDGKIMVTKAGIKFLNNPVKQFKEQILQLQITNPMILKYCKNVFVFPFKEILKLLLKLNYLTINEIGYIIFTHFKKEENFKIITKEISKFRHLPKIKKKKLIEKFKKTPEGNVALAKAPSVGYFISFLLHANFCDKVKINGELGIKLKNKNETKLLLNKYKEAKTFNFEDNLDLWIKYIGDPNILYPPREITIKFKKPDQKDKLILIFQNNEQIGGDLINAINKIKIPLFTNEKYLLKVINPQDGSNLGFFKIGPIKNRKEILINLRKIKPSKIITEKGWVELIKEHIENPDFDSAYGSYLNILKLKNLLDKKIINGRLRGGRFEFLFYKFLKKLEKKGIIKNLNWNGRLKKYGIAEPAPGGKQGLPDITFSINNINFVLELTTIKSKSGQWSAEGSSVPDHIRTHFKKIKKGPIFGIFCAPYQYDRNIKALESNLKPDKIPILCYNVNDLLSILLSKKPLKIFLKKGTK